MAKKIQRKQYEVTLRLPTETVTYPIEAASVLDAKTEMSKRYYGRVFTEQFSRMVARVIQ